MLNAKKGQVTIFIILAVLIVIGAVIYFYLTSEAEITLPKTQLPAVQRVPAEFEPVKNYISECLYKTAEESLIKIGETGGYVSVDEPSLNGNAQIGDYYVKFTSSGESKIVYWRYFEDGLNSFISKAPPLRSPPSSRAQPHSIENQIETYIEKKVDDCIDGFAPFTDKGFSFEGKGDIKAKAVIRDKDVVVEMEFPVKAVRQNSNVDMKDFTAVVPVNIKGIYEMANEIMKLENDFTFFERNVNSILSAYQGDNPRPAPKYEYYFSYSPKVWIRQDVENSMKEVIQGYFQTFRFESPPSRVNPYYSILVTDLISASASSGLRARFNYLYGGGFDWPFEFDMCKREVCRSTNCAGALPIPCQQVLSSYNIEFPVLVEITQPAALSQKDYTFRFFLQSKLKNNDPVTTTLPEPAALDNSFLSSRLCKSSAWDSDEIKISVKDSHKKEPLKESPVYFSVAGETCYLGATNNDGEIKTKLPTFTMGAFLSSSKEGFVSSSRSFDAGVSSEKSIGLELQPIVNKKFNVKKFVYRKDRDEGRGWRLGNAPEELAENEKAIITLSKENTGTGDDFSVLQKFNGSITPDNYPLIGLANGEYKANIQLIKKDTVIIPRSKTCTDILGINIKCVDIPEINFGVEPQKHTHVVKLGNLAAGSHKYKIKCVDISSEDIQSPASIKTASITIQSLNPNIGDLEIISKTKSSFKSREAYIAVQTNNDAECRFREETPSKPFIEPNEGYKNYEPFGTSGLMHISEIKLSQGMHTLNVICKEKTKTAVEWRVGEKLKFDVSTEARLTPEEESKTVLSIAPVAEPDLLQFNTKEAYIALETNQFTTCIYADSTNGEPEDGDYKVMGINKESDFIEGGYNGNIIIENIQGNTKDFITFYVLDMGLDDLEQSKRTIEDLEHWSSLDDKSKALEGQLQPK